MCLNDLDVQILEALGARDPSWTRRWTPEEELARLVRDRRELTAVLARLARNPDVGLRVEQMGTDHHWFLERVSLDRLVESKHSCRPARVSAKFPTPSSATVTPMTALGEDKKMLDVPASAPSLPAIPSAAILSGVEVSCQGRAPTGLPSSNELVPATPDLVGALAQFGIPLAETPRPPHVGHSVLRTRVLLAPGVRLETLRKREEDIGRALGQEVSVISLPGEPYVAIDIPRRPRQLVPILSGIGSLPAAQSKGELWVPLGVTPDGLPISHDLSTLPHLLVAGATGGGKTWLLRGELLSLVLRWGPDDLELVVIDLKSVDFTSFADLPHLRSGGVVSDPFEAIEALRELTEVELPERTRVLKKTGCTNFRELAARAPERAPAAIVVVIDEYADLACVLDRQGRDDLERAVLRLAQRARAAGIHLVLATQRPSADLISGSTKANFPCRVSFRLPQRLDSMVVLDQPGAEKLLGAGDMLLLHDGSLCRLQGYTISVAEEVALLAGKYPTAAAAAPVADAGDGPKPR